MVTTLVVSSQLHPELHRKQRGQQVEGGDSTSLLHFTPPGVLKSSAQERYGAVGEGPEVGHKNGQRAGIPFV